MLALMVTLIPILLLSTQFMQIVVIETPLPQVVQEAIEQDRKKVEREVSIALEMPDGQGFNLMVTVDGKVQDRFKIPKQGDDWDYKELHKKLVTVKRQHPKIFRLNLNPGAKVSYEHIVKVMDAARNLEKEDGKVTISGKDNQVEETDIMFPDVIFANLVEGEV
jgi:biopolymer transport protein ExbD